MKLGYQIDCSRGAAPKVETIKKIIDILNAFKYDYLILYIEDMYQIDSEPYFGALRGRYSHEEIKELDKYAKSRNIELIAGIQTLAHLERLLNHFSFTKYFDIDNILLANDNETYKFIEKMIASISGDFSSRKIHIGMDEAHNLGRGKYLDKFGYENTGKILESHLNNVAKICDKYGYQKIYIWGDMSQKENFEKINYPKNVESMLWYYHPQGKEKLYAQIKEFKKRATEKIAYAGSATKYIGFAPANSFSFVSIKEQIKACKKFGIENYLLTTWGDGCSECSNLSVIPSIFFASLIAHDKKLNNEAKKQFEEVVGLSFKKFMSIDRIINLDPSLDYKGKWNNISFMLLYNDPLQNCMGSIEDSKHKEYLLDACKLMKKNQNNKDFGYIFATLAQLAKTVSYKANIGNDIYKKYKNKEDLSDSINDLKCFQKELKKFISIYEKQWEIENKNFGFEKLTNL